MPVVIRPDDRSAFKRCRRAWDLGSRNRRNLEPVAASPSFDLGEAIRDALAVYYFPGMWEWNRAIVLPLVREGYRKSVARQGPADPAGVAVGERLLEGYFSWAPTVDRFWPVRVETDYSALVPGAGETSYEGRVALLAIDEADAYWLVDHRVRTGEWTDLDELRLDERGVSACWAWENFYLGMRVAGTIYNELRADLAGEAGEGPSEPPPPPRSGPKHRRMYARAAEEPAEDVHQQEAGPFRRTRIARSAGELAHAAEMLALEVAEMTKPGLALYPTPSEDHCPTCEFQAPCIRMSAGLDASDLLAACYRTRPPEQVEEGRLGGVTWGMNRGAMPDVSRARDQQRLRRS